MKPGKVKIADRDDPPRENIPIRPGRKARTW
jgi:hypothetical protein